MKNSERQQKLFNLAKEALTIAWPDKVELVESEKYLNEYHIVLTRTDGEKVEKDTIRNCSVPELFQYVAGIAKDYRPDYQYVFDAKKKEFRVIDTVDYTDVELHDRFRPLEAPGEGEHYEYRHENGKDKVFLVKKSGIATPIPVEPRG